jgi:hypothetical protein
MHMADPIFSPDGKWMWVGSEWIPSPPSGGNKNTQLKQLADSINDNDLKSTVPLLSVSDSVVMGDVIQNIEHNSDPEEIDRIVRERHFEQLSPQLLEALNKRNWDDSFSLLQQISTCIPSAFSVETLNPGDTYAEAFKILDGSLDLTVEQGLNGIDLNGHVQNLRNMLEAKRIESFSIPFIKNQFKQKRIENNWDPIFVSDYNVLNVIEDGIFTVDKFKQCLKSIISELSLIYQLKRMLNPKYDQIPDAWERRMVPYFEADVISLRMIAVSNGGVSYQYVIDTIHSNCIPLYDSLHGEGILVSEGIANHHCMNALRRLRDNVKFSGIFTRIFSYFTLFCMPFFIGIIAKWFMLLNDDSNFVNGSYQMDPLFGFSALGSMFLSVMGAFYLSNTLPINYRYNQIKRWCQPHLERFNMSW